MTKGELAKELFLSGKNCAVSVALAFEKEMELASQDIEKLIIGFGGGFGRQRLVCGAVSGMTMVLGKVLSNGQDRASIYPIIKEACERFKSELGSVICGELLNGVVVKDGSTTPEARTQEYYQKRPCADICQIAGDIVEQIIKENT